MSDPKARKRLRLILDVPGIWADDLDELAAVWADGEEVTDADRLLVATEEWFRREAIIVLTTIPGEKCLNDDFEVLPRPCRIVGVQAVAGEPDEGEPHPWLCPHGATLLCVCGDLSSGDNKE